MLSSVCLPGFILSFWNTATISVVQTGNVPEWFEFTSLFCLSETERQQLDISQHAGLFVSRVDMHLLRLPPSPDPEAEEFSSRTSSSTNIWESASCEHGQSFEGF